MKSKYIKKSKINVKIDIVMIKYKIIKQKYQI